MITKPARKTRFDLEQDLMSCLTLIDELKFICDQWSTIPDNKKENIIRGLVDLYNFKFDNVFNTFEEVISSAGTKQMPSISIEDEHLVV